jgi:hypothetical protein
MPSKRGSKQNRERAMGDAELRTAYSKIFIKYALKGIAMPHPETLPIFQKERRNFQNGQFVSEIQQKVSE